MSTILDGVSRFLSFPPLASGFADAIGHFLLYWFSWVVFFIRIPLTLLHVANMLFKRILLLNVVGGVSNQEYFLTKILRYLLSPPIPGLPNYHLSLVNFSDSNFNIPYKDNFNFPSLDWEKQNLHFGALACKLSYEDIPFFRYTVEKTWASGNKNLGFKYNYLVQNTFEQDQASSKNAAQWIKFWNDLLISGFIFVGQPMPNFIKRIQQQTLVESLRVDTQTFIFSTNNAVVAVFRGTEPLSIVDWATDFNLRLLKVGTKATPSPFGPGDVRVHEGFLAALGLHPSDERPPTSLYDDKDKAYYESHLYYRVSQKLIELSGGKVEKKKIVILGHSLGAALASVFAARFLHDPSGEGFGEEETKGDGSYFLLKRRARFGGLYTYGQPRAGNDVYAKNFAQFEAQRKIHRIVNNFDIIPRTPLGAESDNNRDLNGPLGMLHPKEILNTGSSSKVEYEQKEDSHWFPALTSIFSKWNSERKGDVYVHHGKLHYLNTVGAFENFTPNIIYDLVGPPFSLFYKTFYELRMVTPMRTLVRLVTFPVAWVGCVVNDHAPGDYELHLRDEALYQTRPQAGVTKK